jgi:hypothetical protein
MWGTLPLRLLLHRGMRKLLTVPRNAGDDPEAMALLQPLLLPLIG